MLSLTIIALAAIVGNVVLVLVNNRTAPKPPDLYLSINVSGDLEEDDGDDPDEDELEPDVIPDEVPPEDNTIRSN